MNWLDRLVIGFVYALMAAMAFVVAFVIWQVWL